jgi:CRP-like cAMP-binding protein
MVRRMMLTKREREYLDTEHEEERLRMYEGQCFGEWGLIYNIPRTGSALALSDSVLFYIDKEDFDKSLSVSKSYTIFLLPSLYL